MSHISPELKKLIGGVALAAIVGFGTSFIGMHTSTALNDKEMVQLKLEVSSFGERAERLEQDAETNRMQLIGLNSILTNNVKQVDKLVEVVRLTRESSLTGLKTLDIIAKSHDNLLKVAASLQIAVAKLDTLVSMNKVNEHVVNGGVSRN